MKTQRLIMYLLMLCGWGILLLHDARQSQHTAYAQSSGPTLSIPTGIRAGNPGTVVVPINFERLQSGVAALTFSITYDPACLSIAANNAENAVEFMLPAQMRGSILFDAADTDGQLDIAIADYAPPLATLPDSAPLLEITFTVVCDPPTGTTITTPVEFGLTPPVSFSNTLGRAIGGSTTNGTVIIQHGALPPSPTPSVTPPPEETPEPENVAPVAVDDSAVTREFRAVNIDVLANDSDADDDNLTITSVTQGGFGAVTIEPDGTVLYVPEPGRNGEDLFTYIISDGRGGLAEGLVEVTVSEFNIPPSAQDDSATTVRNREVIIDVLDNDFDVDAVNNAPPLSIIVLGQPEHGSTQLNADNTVTYSPTPGYIGPDEFLYSVLDSEGGSDFATVTITVNPFNRAPEVEPQTEVLSYEEGRELSFQVTATDPDGDTNLQFSATDLPPGVSINPTTGEIQGTPEPGTSGIYTVTVIVSDGTGSTSITFTLEITAPPTYAAYMPLLGR